MRSEGTLRVQDPGPAARYNQAVPRRPITPVLFLAAGGLFLAAALRDMFFPTLFSDGNGQPDVSIGVVTVFLILGMALRRRRRDR